MFQMWGSRMIYYLNGSLMLSYLAINSFTDIKKKKIYVIVSLFFFVVGLVFSIISKQQSLISLLGGVGIGVILLLVGKFSRQSVGFGDGLIFLVTGLYLGFTRNIVLLLYGLIICAVSSVILITFKKFKLKDKIPFAPFVLVAYVSMLLLEV